MKFVLRTYALAFNMQTINQAPVFADFANRDVDGAIRLITEGTLSDIKRLQLSLAEGQHIWLTDNDVEVIGTLTFRDGVGRSS